MTADAAAGQPAAEATPVPEAAPSLAGLDMAALLAEGSRLLMAPLELAPLPDWSGPWEQYDSSEPMFATDEDVLRHRLPWLEAISARMDEGMREPHGWVTFTAPDPSEAELEARARRRGIWAPPAVPAHLMRSGTLPPPVPGLTLAPDWDSPEVNEAIAATFYAGELEPDVPRPAGPATPPRGTHGRAGDPTLSGEPAAGANGGGPGHLPDSPGPDRAGDQPPPVTTAPCAADALTAKGDSAGPGDHPQAGEPDDDPAAAEIQRQQQEALKRAGADPDDLAALAEPGDGRDAASGETEDITEEQEQ